MTVDVRKGENLTGWNMELDRTLKIRAGQAIPLGHKIALRNIAKGEEIVKYDCPIGRASRDIKAGEHVHTHNLKTARW